MKTAAHQGLYDPEDEIPTLRGTRCDACGSTFFPPLDIGCEVCGATADRLTAVPIAAAGVLHSVATVHLHPGNDITAPFALGEIQLDDGPLIRATMIGLPGLDRIGRRVEAQWVVARTDSDGNEVVEPRFAVVSDNGPAGGAS
jgi:uncharacterized OB-fold protein